MKSAFFITDDELTTSSLGNGVRLKQDLLTSYLGISTGMNHFLFDIMEKTAQLSFTAGIFQHSRAFHIWVDHRDKIKSQEKNSKVIRIDDLKFLFTIWSCSMGISLIVLALEVILNLVRNTIGNFTAMILVLKNILRV
jgi:hypothetical protein